MVIWVASLTLVGFTPYSLSSHQNHFYGYTILLAGWLSPLAGNFAWFANIFFLNGYARLKKIEKSAVIPAILAVVLSLDTVRLSWVTMNEGGSSLPIYGYGWGAVLWFLSMFLLLAAAGTRQVEECPSGNIDLGGNRLRFIGLVCSVATIVISIYWAANDRATANLSDYQRLAGIAFKRGDVCSTPDPIVVKPLTSLNGSLNIVIHKNVSYANSPFNRIEELLEWGIPTIRVGNRDYSMDNREVISNPAEKDVSATLYIYEVRDKGSFSGDIRAKLIAADSGRIVFDQVWEKLPFSGKHYYCPDYYGSPNADMQPRKLLMTALNIVNYTNLSEARKYQFSSTRRLKAKVVSTAGGGGEILPTNNLQDADCPLGIGWDGENNKFHQNLGRAFTINPRTYHLRRHMRGIYNAICVGDNVYLYNSSEDSITISKRALANFEESWRHVIVLPQYLSAGRKHSFRIKTILDTDIGAKLELVSTNNDMIINLKVSFEAEEHIP